MADGLAKHTTSIAKPRCGSPAFEVVEASGFHKETASSPHEIEHDRYMEINGCTSAWSDTLGISVHMPARISIFYLHLGKPLPTHMRRFV